MLDSTTRMLLAFPISVIDMIFAWISSLVIGPVFSAMSLVPARMTTTFGLRSTTSGETGSASAASSDH